MIQDSLIEQLGVHHFPNFLRDKKGKILFELLRRQTMSIMAYRIIEIKLADPSFKLWDNSKLLQFLENNIDFSINLNSNGGGKIEIPVKILKRAVKMSKSLDIDEKTITKLNQDIDFATSKNNDYVIYECF